jgi:periplasmic protein CpxP/Spy
MKFSWKTLSVATASISALLLISAMVVFSQGRTQGQGGPPDGGGFRRGPGGPRDGMFPMFRDLNLSEDQKSQIKKIMETAAANDRELHEKMRTLRGSEPAPFSTTFDEATVRSAAEARAKIDVELQVSRARTMSQVAAILTEEQRAQLAARGPKGPRGPEGPPPPPEP